MFIEDTLIDILVQGIVTRTFVRQPLRVHYCSLALSVITHIGGLLLAQYQADPLLMSLPVSLKLGRQWSIGQFLEHLGRPLIARGFFPPHVRYLIK